MIICHVISADKYLETELSCEDPTSQKDWVTNEVYFGGLPEGGLLLDLPVTLTQLLVDKKSKVFALLGQYLKPFESAIGVNGKVYIKTAGGDNLRAVLIGQDLEKCETLTLAELESLCQDMERRLRH